MGWRGERFVMATGTEDYYTGNTAYFNYSFAECEAVVREWDNAENIL